jgi:nucleotide-binding universal stress UspA family protein
MFSRVIVGVDGKDGGSDAIALARALAAADAEIVLVNVYPYEDAQPSEGALAQFERLLLDEATGRLRGALPDDPRCIVHPVASVLPARALQDEAERRDADLIVVGSSHRGAIGRVLLGDVSRAVLHGAPCPVAVAPHGQRDTALEVRTVGAGVDDSPAARAAAGLAATLAADAGAQLRLVAVFQQPVPFSPAYAYSFDWVEEAAEQRRAATELLEGIAAGLPVAASTEAVEGSPTQELEKLSHEVDLLVLGSRGWGAVRRVVLGSTADRVMHAAGCPVLLAPVPAD